MTSSIYACSVIWYGMILFNYAYSSNNILYYYVLDVILRALLIVTQLTLTATLWGRYYHYPYFLYDLNIKGKSCD